MASGSIAVSRCCGELTAWAGHRHRRVLTRTATKNQLLGQLDRCFPGLTLALPDVLGTKVGRLVAEHFADPHRLAGLGSARFIRYAAVRGLQVRRPVADRLVAAARDALPSPDAAVARQVLAADLALLAGLDTQIQAAEARLAELLPANTVRAAAHRPRLGRGAGRQLRRRRRRPAPLARRPKQLYRASGLSPAQYESAGKRRDGAISREGSVELRRALIDLGIGLWLHRPGRPNRYGQQLRARGKKGGVIGCAMAHRANKIAYALVRDQTGYDPTRWA